MLPNILHALDIQLDMASRLIKDIPAETLEPERPSEDTRTCFPTIGAVVAFSQTSHEMDHLGQIAAWQRAACFGPASA